MGISASLGACVHASSRIIVPSAKKWKEACFEFRAYKGVWRESVDGEAIIIGGGGGDGGGGSTKSWDGMGEENVPLPGNPCL